MPSPLQHPTKNDLSATIRGSMIELLGFHLANALDLQHQAKQAHWNVKGPAFIGLHKLFEEVYGHAVDSADTLAERIVQLGGIADGSVRTVMQMTVLAPFPQTIAAGTDHVAALSSALAAFGARLRTAITQSAQDAVTQNIFITLTEANDKLLWFVEAHEQAAK